MRYAPRVLCVVGLLVIAAHSANPKTSSASSDERNAIVIVFKDGHQQSFPVADIARIEFKAPVVSVSAPPSVSAAPLGRKHFVGKWEVGDGNGHTFLITLEDNGDARKSIGATRGTWTVVDGEARISWDDGWRDVIRKVGTTHEKFAYEPGKSLSDEPSNVTNARMPNPQPI